MLSKPKRLLAYKIVAVLFALFLFFMPENMTILPDMDLRVLITTLALDYQSGEYMAAAQVIVPDKTGLTDMKTASGKGNSVAKAVDELERSIGKKADLKQCAMVVIGDSLARENIIKPLSYLFSSAEVSPGAAVVYTKDINKFIENAVALTDSSGTGIGSFTLFNKNEINLPTITLLSVLSGLNAPSGCVYLPNAKLDTSTPPSHKKQDTAPAVSPATAPSKKETVIKNLTDVVVIKGHKMVGELPGDKTSGITWLEKASNRGLVQLDDFVFNGQSLGAVPASLKYKSAKIKAKFNGAIPEVTFKISVIVS